MSNFWGAVQSFFLFFIIPSACRCGHKYLVLNRGMNLASCAAGINQHYYLRENNLYNIRSISCVVCRCRSDGPSQERGAGACGRYRDAVGDHRRRLSRPQVHHQTSRRHRLLGPLSDQSGETLLDARRQFAGARRSGRLRRQPDERHAA